MSKEEDYPTYPIIDIGINLGSPKYKGYHEDILNHAFLSDIMAIISISNSRGEWDKNLKLIEEFKIKEHIVKIYCTIGIHPHNASTIINLDDKPIEKFTKLAKLKEDLLKYHKNTTDVVAVGECGLDFNRLYSPRETQIDVFMVHIDVAAETGKPLYLHERDSSTEMIKILTEAKAKYPHLRGVIHCFTGNRRTLRAYIDLGFYIGITGWICDNRRNQDLLDAVMVLPLNKLLIETDGPYLTPPQYVKRFDTKRNESDSLEYIIKRLSIEMEESVERIRSQTYKNTLKLFKISL